MKRLEKEFYMIDSHGSYRKLKSCNEEQVKSEALSIAPDFKEIGMLSRVSPVKSKSKIEITFSLEEAMAIALSYPKLTKR